MPMLRSLVVIITAAPFLAALGARAQQPSVDAPLVRAADRVGEQSPEEPQESRAHGPEAPDGQFPSHVFQWRARTHERVQLGFTYGLSQPILAHGFNEIGRAS